MPRLSCHERLKQSLHSTSGMLLFSSSTDGHREVLHRAQRATHNFHSAIAWLRRDPSILRTSSSPAAVLLVTEDELVGATRSPSTDALPEVFLPPVEEEEEEETVDRTAAAAAAAVRIQAFYRGHRARASVVSAAVKLEAAYRMWTARRRYKRMQGAAEKIQRSYRAWHSKKLTLETRCAAALVIQSHARGLVARRWTIALQEEKRRAQAASRIQASYKGTRSRRQYLLMRSSARKIEAAYRKWKISRERELAAEFVRKNRPPSSQAMSLNEDWNNVEVDRLDQCLDTCLAALHPGGRPQDRPTSSPSYVDEESGDKKSVNEKKLQQVARVFLLQHHIALQQQHAKKAPPFPPSSQNNNSSHLYTSTRPENTIAKPKNDTGDVVLDVQYLLEEVHKLGASSDPVLYMQNDPLGLSLSRQEVANFKQMNTLLVVIVAVVIYTRSICQEVFVWAKQSTKK